MTYRIKDWHKHFENGDALRYKSWSWLPLPNQHDGKKWGRLWKLERAPEIFAAFILLLELASKMPERGVLADDEGKLSTGDMAIKTQAPQALFDFAIPQLMTLGWIELHKSAQICGLYNRTEPNRTEQNIAAIAAEIYQGWPVKTKKRNHVNKSPKDKIKIEKILADGKYPLADVVKRYLELAGDYPKDLKTFLNNLPDISILDEATTTEDVLKL